MKLEKEVLIFRTKTELYEYTESLLSPTSQVSVDGQANAKYPLTVDVTHVYGRKFDSHHIDFRKPKFRKPKFRIINWFKQSNRWKHLLYGFLVSIIAGLNFTLGCAAGMEFKDRLHGGKWDWIDFGLTVAGGLAGSAIQLTIINLLGWDWLKYWL